MKILVTADLHYDIPRSRGPAEQLATRVVRTGGDALVLVGDSAGANLDVLRECLRLFEGFGGLKLLVPGNHCLWRRPGEDSIERYERLIPQAAREEGFTVLDHEPVALGEVGLVGSVGWYDYSFRDKSLGIPLPFYAAKVAPGAAAYYREEYEQLLADHADELDEAHWEMFSRWMDGRHVRLNMSDEEFVERLARKLSSQLAEVAPRVGRIAAFLHHLPFAELVPANRPTRFAFAAAYMGADRLGQVLLDCPKVTHVYCGHSHWRADRRVGRIRVVNVGSTYTEKRLEVAEL